MVDAFFVGMILSDEDKDLHVLQGIDLENKILLHMETEQEECCMASSQVNCLSLNRELIHLLINERNNNTKEEEENDNYDEVEEHYNLGDGWDKGDQSNKGEEEDKEKQENKEEEPSKSMNT